MSIRIMTAVWDLSLADSEKIVLLALADNANDGGVCWPSIATIARKCCKSERTVQVAIRSLETSGYLIRRERPGKGVVYTVTPAAAAPRNDCTPQPSHHTPAAAAPKPSLNHQEDTNVSSPVFLPEHVVEAWNEMAGRIGLPQIRRLTPERKRKLQARMRENPLEDWMEALNAIERSAFLRGEEGTWRGATFDFLLQPSSFQKLIEGSYDRQAK